MKSARKILAALLAAAMVLAMSVSVLAASFSDLEGHWAKSYMEDLSERGMLSGYPDGTMKPDNKITGAEAVAFLAKLYATTEAEDEAIHEDFGTVADAATTISWVKPYLEKALACGILAKDELKTLALSEPIEKQQLAQLIVRAVKLQEEAEALEDTQLSFADAEEVDSKYVGSVALLAQLKITVGDTANKFGPKGSVTRAIAATMVSRIITYAEENDTDLTIEGYSGLSQAEGFLTAADDTSYTIRDSKGIFHVYEKADDFSSSINTGSKTTSAVSSLTGCPVKLRLLNGEISYAEITAESGVQYVQTKFLQTSSKSGGIKTYDYYTDASENYDCMKAVFTMDGTTLSYSQLKEDDFLTIKIADQDITEVKVTRGSTQLSAVVKKISYGTTVQVLLSTEDGVVLLPLKLADLPEISRGGHESGIDKLAVGDSVKITVCGGEITSIAIDSTNSTETGTISAISQTAEGTTWTITKENGKEKTYDLARNVIAYSGTTKVKTSAFDIGDEVSLLVVDDQVSEITLVKAHAAAGSATEKLVVTVINVDVKGKKLAVITEDDEFFYVSCGYSATILNTATGTVNLSSISAGDEITLHGSFNEDGEFVPTTIIIEK